MAWNTPTITTTRGRLIRHTYITAVGTLNGTTDVNLDLADLPVGIFAGTIQARADDQTDTDKTLLILRSGITTVGSVTDNNIYRNELTISGNPDYFPIASIFEEITVPTAANFMGAIALPTNELRVLVNSDNVAETDGTVTIYIGLLSHVLEV